MPMRTVRGALPSGQGCLDLVRGGAFRQSPPRTQERSARQPRRRAARRLMLGIMGPGHVKQLPMTFDGETFASGLKGASHPVGTSLRLAGATKSSRSPLPDRSTMASCVIDRELATTDL